MRPIDPAARLHGRLLKGENFDMCGRPPVTIRRWMRDDGYDDCELLPKEGAYGPACKTHANHDVVLFIEVLKSIVGLLVDANEDGN